MDESLSLGQFSTSPPFSEGTKRRGEPSRSDITKQIMIITEHGSTADVVTVEP